MTVRITNRFNQDLVLAQTSSNAWNIAYRRAKEGDRRLTLGFLCRSIGLSSTGYLTDVFKGRRILNKKYREQLARTLGLTGLHEEFVLILCELDDQPAQILRTRLEDRRRSIAKQFLTQSRSLPKRLAAMVFAFEVFAAFGLFQNVATRQKLQALFGRGRGVEIDRALQILIAAELVEALGGGNFRLNSHSINFAESEDGFSHLDFLKGAMKDAENAVDKWYARADRSFFTWSILSVKRAEYERLLPKLKDQIRVFEADLDGSDADSLIRFNVQVYPIGVERREGTS